MNHTEANTANAVTALFDVNDPRTYEKHLLEIWSTYLMHLSTADHPHHFVALAESMYHLITFLQAVEEGM